MLSVMSLFLRLIAVSSCVAFLGCSSVGRVLFGQGAEYRAEYEEHKAAVLAATDASSEAKALRELGLWFRDRPYSYTLSTASQPNIIGVDLTRLRPGEQVELRIHAKSDYEPREGGFKFVPKDKTNLLLLEDNPIEDSG